MASTGKAFDQVKAILGKLDRQVDEARHKRLGDDDLPIRPARNESQASAFETPASNGAPDPNGPNAGMPARQSKYGRARPLNRTGDATGAWSSPTPRNGHGLDETVG
ncbi:MAG: hypothetical protein R3B57_13255 [Phycisphaerales bacterium]